ncbi:MAG TPA: prephenate dehydrogenase/arogenate dehydrogenase family protein [Solirubrobacteraceae bacterium]|nr:prephenate dehydrogenase/arogenate dehydrogenase family protein [Solirubrobacteraceae bacterium]
MRIAVVGVGLIGGSIGLAARARTDARVCGYDPDPGVRERALALGAIDAAAEDVAGAVADAEVAFVAAPVGALPEMVALALAAAPADCVVSDVGSTKRVVADACTDERFVGGHPLAGLETAGVEHARADLFDGATWYLTPAEGRTAGVLYERLHRLLGALGARPTAIDPEAHDRVMACVSHLPHVLANVLAAQATGVLGGQDGGESAVQLPAVGPSFRDATRVAGANSAIWTDIYRANAGALLDAIGELDARLAQVRTWLTDDDGDALTAWNDAARADRDALLGQGATGGTLRELRASVPNRPGVVADIALALGRAGVNIDDMALAPSRDNRQGVVSLWVGADQAERARELIAELGFPVVAA